jgi:hypothetical protein
VDVLAHLRALGHRVDHVGGEIVRVRAREPDPPEPLDLVHGAKQLGEQRPAGCTGHGQIASERVHVLTEEGDLDHAPAGEPLHLGEHVADRARQLWAADERHDAERARVVAPDGDRDPRVV